MAVKIKKETEVVNDDTVSYSGEPEEKETVLAKENLKEETAKISEDEKPILKEEKAEPQEPVEEDDFSKGRNWSKILLIISLITNLGLVMLLFGSQASKIGMFSASAPTPTPLEIRNSPTPTPEEIDLKAHDIEIQNGSGIAGEGAKIKETLEKAGFKVGEISNADNSNYDETIITVSDKVEEAYIDELTKVLEVRGAVGKVEKFAEGENGEVRIIIGSDLTEEDTDPTPTRIP